MDQLVYSSFFLLEKYEIRLIGSTVRGFSVSSSKKRGVKRASPLTPMKLGLKMCVLPRGILIQAVLTQFQVGVRMSQKKVPKMAKISYF